MTKKISLGLLILAMFITFFPQAAVAEGNPTAYFHLGLVSKRVEHIFSWGTETVFPRPGEQVGVRASWRGRTDVHCSLTIHTNYPTPHHLPPGSFAYDHRLDPYIFMPTQAMWFNAEDGTYIIPVRLWQPGWGLTEAIDICQYTIEVRDGWAWVTKQTSLLELIPGRNPPYSHRWQSKPTTRAFDLTGGEAILSFGPVTGSRYSHFTIPIWAKASVSMAIP